MSWKRARFKDQDVWAEVTDAGAPVVEGGRTPIRYQRHAGAKTYRAGASRVELVADAPLEDLDAGDPAPAQPSARGAASGFGSAGTRTEAQAALAADAARSLIEALKGRAILCFTDGACRGNPGPAGSGAVVQPPEGPVRERSQSLGRATNNVAELTAIRMALELVEEMGAPSTAEVAIFTDSKYAHGVLTKGWKAKANADLVTSVREALARRPGATIHWIAGHVGVEGNERADALANAGVDANR